MTKNLGKRATTTTAGAPLTGGHARFDLTVEEKLSTSNSALIASLELRRKRVPSEWKDRLSARSFTVEQFQVTMNMLEENPNEEPGEKKALAAALLSDEAPGKERAKDAAPLPHDTHSDKQTLSDVGQPSAQKHGARARKHFNDLFTFSSFQAPCVEAEQPTNEEHANGDEWCSRCQLSPIGLASSGGNGATRGRVITARATAARPVAAPSSGGNGATRGRVIAARATAARPVAAPSSGGNGAIGDSGGSSGGNRAMGDSSGSSGGNRAMGDSSGSSGGNGAIGDSSSASKRSRPSHSGQCISRSANSSSVSKFSASYSSSAREISSTYGQDQPQPFWNRAKD